MRSRLATFVILGLALLVFGNLAWADHHIITWKLNVAKSKYSPGPAPKSSTLKIESQKDGVKVSLNSVNAEGQPVHFDYTAKFDGKDYPVTGWATADQVSVKRIDENTMESVMKKGGKIVSTTRSVISKDGKTRTSTQKGKNAQGQDTNNTLVYDKQ